MGFAHAINHAPVCTLNTYVAAFAELAFRHFYRAWLCMYVCVLKVRCLRRQLPTCMRTLEMRALFIVAIAHCNVGFSSTY